MMDDFAMPDTALARQAHEFITAHGTPWLVNHGVRSYLFGRAVGEQEGLRPDEDYDDEVLLLACLLHDLGLTEHGDGDQRFEVDGADAAAGFLRGRGLDEARTEVAWQAIALHTSLGIADRMRPEIALTHAGTRVDMAALGAGLLPEGFAGRVHATYPRFEIGAELAATIVGQALRKPAKAPLFTLSFELLRQSEPATVVPRWEDIVDAAWPGVV